MLRWSVLKVPDQMRHPGLADVALADSIYMVEEDFHANYARREQQERAMLGLTLDEPTPPALMRRISDVVQEQTCRELREMASHAPTGDDNLLARVLCHAPANRALAELGKLDEVSEQVLKVANVFSVLKLHGEDALPAVRDDEDIRRELNRWFGPDGLCVEVLGRTHTKSHLEFTLRLAERVQQDFIETRGRAAGALAKEAFGGMNNKLVFALVLVSCFYSGEKVANELVAAHNSKRAAYPGPLARNQTPGPHSLELYKSVFSHIAFANTGWRIDPAAMRAYAQAAAHKRAMLQGLIFEVFKYWHPQVLLELHTRLMARRELLAIQLPHRSGTARVDA